MCYLKETHSGHSLVVQWIKLCILNAGGPGSIPGQETKILQAMRCYHKKRKR